MIPRRNIGKSGYYWFYGFYWFFAFLVFTCFPDLTGFWTKNTYKIKMYWRLDKRIITSATAQQWRLILLTAN